MRLSAIVLMAGDDKGILRMKICVDLDGTICHTKKSDQEYKDVKPIKGAVKALQELKQQGFYIIVYTARNMRTYNNNLGKIIKAQGKLITNWLEEYDIPYDELVLGKPHVDYFIDDKAIRFENNWDEIAKILLSKSKDKV